MEWAFKTGQEVLDQQGEIVRVDVQNSNNGDLEKRYFVKYPDGRHGWRKEDELSLLPSLKKKNNNKKKKKNATKVN